MDLSYQITHCKPSRIQNLLTFLLIVSYGGVLVQFFTYSTEIVCVILVFLILAQTHSKIIIPRGFVKLYILIVFVCLISSVATGTNIIKYISFLYRPIIAILILNAFNLDLDLLKHSMARMLNLICKMALVSFILMPFIHDLLPIMTSSGGFVMRTLCFIINTDPDIPPYIEFILPIYRNQGVFTEPGLLGIVANIYLFILLFEYKYGIKQCWLPIVVIVSAMSTTGFLILGFQLIIWGFKYVLYNKKHRLKSTMWVGLAFLLLLPVVYTEVNKKFTREGGTGREYDTFMALEVVAHNPLIGIGPDKNRYLLETRKYSVVVNDQIRSEERGNSNGLIALLYWMGVPIAILFMYGIYKQNIFKSNRKVFIAIICMMFFGEPNVLNDFVFLILISSSIRKKQLELEPPICLQKSVQS